MKISSFLLACMVLFFVIIACNQHKETRSIQASAPVQIDSLPGNCPYLTHDNKNNTVISWARSLNDSTAVFCYAVSSGDGKTFGKAITIPGSENLEPHSENLPKIVFKPSGEIIALWGASNPNPKNKYAGLVYYSQSFDDAATWSKPRPLVNDTSGFDQRYYDVDLLPNGEAAILWLDNRKKSAREGSALYFATTQGNRGFQNEKMIGEGCCQCCRTDLFIDKSGGIHALYRGIIRDSIRDMLHCVSVDNGRSFSEPKLISNDHWVIKGCPHTGPSMTENKAGIHFAWFTGGGDKGCFYTRSGDNGENFNLKEPVSGAGAHPQIAAFPAGDLLLAWDESVQVNNQYYKRINVQHRSEEGVVDTQSILTSDTVTATYPVLSTAKSGLAILAYNEKKGKDNFITWRRIEIK